MGALKVAAAVLSVLAFACAISATFAPAWVSGNGQVFRGFFGYCIRGTCRFSSSLLNATSGTQASAAFMIIGTFVLLAGACFVIKGVSKPSTMKTGGVVTILGGVAALIGAAVFAGIVTVYDPIMYSASFGLAWVAVVLGIAGGALALASSRE